MIKYIMIKMLEIMEGEKDRNDEIGFNHGNNENGESREKSWNVRNDENYEVFKWNEY